MMAGVGELLGRVFGSGGKSPLQRRMRADWDQRARANARYFVNTEKDNWTEEEFFSSGERTVAEEVLSDMTNICQGQDPRQMRILEIGCGVGRVTRALAGVFGEVHALDVSKQMIRQARKNLKGLPNVRLHVNNGADLSVLPNKLMFDFAFSCIVFQHIPSREVIENYIREVHRVLRPGRLFKFQVQGYLDIETSPDDTWRGIPFTEEQIVATAERCGFEPRHRYGAGTQYFWQWFFKKP